MGKLRRYVKCPPLIERPERAARRIPRSPFDGCSQWPYMSVLASHTNRTDAMNISSHSSLFTGVIRDGVRFTRLSLSAVANHTQ